MARGVHRVSEVLWDSLHRAIQYGMHDEDMSLLELTEALVSCSGLFVDTVAMPVRKCEIRRTDLQSRSLLLASLSFTDDFNSMSGESIIAPLVAQLRVTEREGIFRKADVG